METNTTTTLTLGERHVLAITLAERHVRFVAGGAIAGHVLVGPALKRGYPATGAGGWAGDYDVPLGEVAVIYHHGDCSSLSYAVIGTPGNVRAWLTASITRRRAIGKDYSAGVREAALERLDAAVQTSPTL